MSNQLTVRDEVKNSLSTMKEQFAAVLPKDVDADKFIRVAQTAIMSTPKLLECNRKSLYLACMKSAEDGLIPDGKSAALVPYGEKVQYIQMIHGLIQKIHKTNQVKDIIVNVVHKGDHFFYGVKDNKSSLEHEPDVFGERGPMIGCYCMINMKSGGCFTEVMSKAQVEKIKEKSRARSGPWIDHPEEMWKKTVIKRTAKRAPIDVDIDGNDEEFQSRDVTPECEKEKASDDKTTKKKARASRKKSGKKKATRLNQILEEPEEPAVDSEPIDAEYSEPPEMNEDEGFDL